MAGKIRKILAVRNDRFGEFLLNIPALKALKQSYPEATLVLIVNPYVEELALCLDFIDEILTWENKKHWIFEVVSFSNKLRRKGFDLCLILNPSKEFNLISFLAGIPIRVGYARKWGFLLNKKIRDDKYLGLKHEVEYNLELAKLAGAKIQDKKIYLSIDTSIVDNFIDLCDNKTLVAIHPWASDAIKQWPIDKFRGLVARLTEESNIMVILVGGPEEAAISQGSFAGFQDNKVVNLIGKTSLKELAAVLKKCKLLVSADSGPMHLAAAVGTKVIAIFRNDIIGKTSKRWGPWGQNHTIIESPNLDNISVGEVFEEVKEKIRQ